MNIADYYKKGDTVIGIAKILFNELRTKYENVKIKDICYTTSGGTPNRGNLENYNGNIPWLKSGELNDGLITNSEEFITEKGLKNSSAKLFPKETLLVAMYGATAGKTGILDFDAATNQAVCALFPKEALLRDYLYWFLRQHRLDFIIQSKGGAQPNISQKVIKATEIPIPSKDIQKEVIRFLNDVYEKSKLSECNLLSDYSFKCINKYFLIRNSNSQFEKHLHTQKQLIAQLKQSILQEAIQGKLTSDFRTRHPELVSGSHSAEALLERIKVEKAQLIKEKKIKKEKPLPPITEEEIPFEVPKNWVWCRIGEIYQSTSGGTPTRSNHEYWNGKIKWYKSGELNDSLLSIDSKEHITNKGLKESSATLFPKGTLLIAMYGATAGKLAILNSEATTNQAVCGFFENNMLSTSYLFNFFRANRDKMISESWGMSQPNISQTYLKNFVFALPPLEEQKAIVEKIETLMQKCNALEQEVIKSEQHANMLMQTVLKEAFESKTEQPLEEKHFVKRKMLASYIINQSANDDKFGDTKFEKLLHLADYHILKRNFGQEYKQKAAGPYDNKFTVPFFNQTIKAGWFYKQPLGNMNRILQGRNNNKSQNTYDYFSDNELEKINGLIETFKNFDYKIPEIISTIYAVWNNRIIKNQEITDQLLKQDFLDWDKGKAQYVFPKDRVTPAIKWMKENGFIPNGWGKIIEPPKSKTKRQKE